MSKRTSAERVAECLEMGWELKRVGDKNGKKNLDYWELTGASGVILMEGWGGYMRGYIDGFLDGMEGRFLRRTDST